MFDAQKLLGSLMGDALSGALGGTRRKQKRRPSGLAGLMGGGGSSSTKLKMGVGLLGLAYAAYEHYQKPAENASTSTSASPPPAPSSSTAMPPPPSATSANNEHALHLIRAMITAADADGLIDAEERESIVTRAREAGLDAESLQALDVEISAPLSLKQLAARTPEILRDETYGAALIAISADTPEEQAFLDQLAVALKLDAQAKLAIHQQLGL